MSDSVSVKRTLHLIVLLGAAAFCYGCGGGGTPTGGANARATPAGGNAGAATAPATTAGNANTAASPSAQNQGSGPHTTGIGAPVPSEPMTVEPPGADKGPSSGPGSGAKPSPTPGSGTKAGNRNGGQK